MSVEAISWALNLAPVPANRMLDPRLEHEHDPGQRRPVIGPLAAGVPVPAGRGRQLRRDPIPQHIRDKIIDHLWQRAQPPRPRQADTPKSFRNI